MTILEYALPEQLQRDIEARINADPLFADIVVVRVEPGDSSQTIKEKLAVGTVKAGKRGAGLLVLPIDEAIDEFPDVPAGICTWSVAVLAVTLPELNNQATGAGKSARRLARAVFENLKLTTFQGVAENLIADTPALLTINAANEPKLRMVQVNLLARESNDAPVTKVAPPIFTPVHGGSAATVTIACATAGSSIYYSTDGSVPWSGAGTLYAGAINVPAQGITLRAAAYKTGLAASNVMRTDITHP